MKSQTKSIVENWKMNLIEKLGLEKCRAIVDGAPSDAEFFHIDNNHYVKNIDRHELSKAKSEPFQPHIIGFESTCYDGWEQNGAWLEYINILIDLNDLRAAIADHNRTDYVSDIRNHIAPTTKVIDK